MCRWATLQYGLAMILTSWLPVVVVLLHSSLPLARPKQGLASGRLSPVLMPSYLSIRASKETLRSCTMYNQSEGHLRVESFHI